MKFLFLLPHGSFFTGILIKYFQIYLAPFIQNIHLHDVLVIIRSY
jgi:hypothetical protein